MSATTFPQTKLLPTTPGKGIKRKSLRRLVRGEQENERRVRMNRLQEICLRLSLQRFVNTRRN